MVTLNGTQKVANTESKQPEPIEILEICTQEEANNLVQPENVTPWWNPFGRKQLHKVAKTPKQKKQGSLAKKVDDDVVGDETNIQNTLAAIVGKLETTTGAVIRRNVLLEEINVLSGDLTISMQSIKDIDTEIDETRNQIESLSALLSDAKNAVAKAKRAISRKSQNANQKYTEAVKEVNRLSDLIQLNENNQMNLFQERADISAQQELTLRLIEAKRYKLSQI